MDLFPPMPTFQGALDQWVERAFESTPRTTAEVGYPSLNVFERQDQVMVEAELPGVKPEDVDVSVAGAEVTLSGERKNVTQPEATWTRQERPCGRFSRTVTLPWDIDPNNVQATLRDGVLSITLTKSEKSRAKKISVSHDVNPR